MMLGVNKGSNETYKRIKKNTVGVELGVWKGDSSEKFLTNAKHLHLVDSWAITPYVNSDEFGGYDKYLERYSKIVGSSNPKDFQKYYDNIARSVENRFKNKPVTIHRMNTKDFFNTFTEKVDWVYVDAAHDFDGCLFDLEHSMKILKDGGIIYGDDYGNKPPVVKAVDAFVKKYKLILNNFHSNQYEIKL